MGVMTATAPTQPNEVAEAHTLRYCVDYFYYTGKHAWDRSEHYFEAEGRTSAEAYGNAQRHLITEHPTKTCYIYRFRAIA